MDEEAVADLDRDLGQMFMAAVHRVAGLEGGNAAPASVSEQRARFRRAIVEPLVLRRESSLAESLYAASEVDWPLLHDLGDARMLGFGRAKDVLALESLVDLIFLGDVEQAHDFI